MNNTQKEQVLHFRVPMLAPEKKPPVAIWRVFLVKREGGQDVLHFEIRRNLAVKVESFTICYRFSNLPVFTPDQNAKFNAYVYDAHDVNTADIIEISAVLPSHMRVSDCGAYISEIRLQSGQVLTFDVGEYRFVRRSAAQGPQSVSHPTQRSATGAQQGSAGATAGIGNMPERPTGAPAPQPTAPEPTLSAAERESRKKKHLGIILSIVAAALVVEIIGGIALYRYLGVKNSTDMLIRDKRYNEAYKIAYDAQRDGILQSVCEKAARFYADKGDLEEAYVYALGAPKPFTDLIIDYAAQSVINATTGKINETAFRVAKMSENDDKFDTITHSVCDILTNRADFANAIRVASELRDKQDRSDTENSVFRLGLSYYARTHRYREAAAFIDELENIPTFKMSKKDILATAIDVCRSIGDSAGIIYLSQLYPDYTDVAASSVTIAADNAGVRSEFSTIYPLLSETQRRAYHAQTVAVWNDDVVLIESDGSINGTKIKDAVSIDTNEVLTLVLHKSGRVSILPHENMSAPYSAPADTDIIDIALGESHAVLLHADGTVSVLGDNSYSQAEVSDWRDIVAVAAGQRFTLGLKMDGTVVATGSNSCAQCDVSSYRNVVDIAACNQSSVFLFSDGTVMVQGYRSMGLSDVEGATGVKRIRAGGAAILTELDDGTYKIFTGNYTGSWGDPYNWRSMVAFDVGMTCIAGVDNIGVLFCDGDGIPS